MVGVVPHEEPSIEAPVLTGYATPVTPVVVIPMVASPEPPVTVPLKVASPVVVALPPTPTVTGATATYTAPKRPICERIPQYVTPPIVECVPGERRPAMCIGSSLMGYRECNETGSKFDRTVCPDEWAGSLNQETSLLIVSRPALRATPGFNETVGALGTFGYRTQVINAEDFVASFPAATIQESIKLGIARAYTELLSLKHVVEIGKSVPGRLENFSEFQEAWEMPAFYIEAPPGTANLDLVVEDTFPSVFPFKNPFFDFSNFGERFRTPEWAKVKVQVSRLPFDGSLEVNGATDLQNFSEKLRSWDPGDTFVESQFDGGACRGENWPMDDDNDLHAGVSHTINYHACDWTSELTTGDLATADGADVFSFNEHGNAAGAGDLFNGNTKFGGVVLGYSCTTGAPDILSESLAEDQLSSPTGAIAYVGYPRVLATGFTSIPNLALVEGKFQLGEAVDGMILKRVGDLDDHVHADKDLAGLTVYGFAGLPLVKAPTKRVRTLASRTNPDGTMDVCVEVLSPAEEVSLQVGGVEVDSFTAATGGRYVRAITIPSEVSEPREIISMGNCDTDVEACQVAGIDPELTTTLECGNIGHMADGSLSVEVQSSLEIRGELSYEVTTTYFNCPNGPRSECYLAGHPWARKDHVLGTASTDKVWTDGNVVAFTLDSLEAAEKPGEDEIFRAIRIELKNPTGNVIGRCYAPMDSYTAEELGLL